MVLRIQEDDGINFSKRLLVELFNLSGHVLASLHLLLTRLYLCRLHHPGVPALRLPVGFSQWEVLVGRQVGSSSGRRELSVVNPPPPCPLCCNVSALSLSQLQLSSFLGNFLSPLSL